MTNRQHFDGTIAAAGARIGCESYGVLAECFGEHRHGDAYRLAACWNICKGIDLATLESLGDGALARLLTASAEAPK
jgi:hypothetical protein